MCDDCRARYGYTGDGDGDHIRDDDVIRMTVEHSTGTQPLNVEAHRVAMAGMGLDDISPEDIPMAAALLNCAQPENVPGRRQLRAAAVILVLASAACLGLFADMLAKFFLDIVPFRWIIWLETASISCCFVIAAAVVLAWWAMLALWDRVRRWS